MKNIKLATLRRSSWMKRYPISEVFGVVLFTCIICFPFQFLRCVFQIDVRANSAELVANLFRECSELEGNYHDLCKYPSIYCSEAQFYSIMFSLMLTAFIKMILTALTFGIQVPAGVFIPSMAIGACIGRAFGLVMESWYNYDPAFFLFSSCKAKPHCVTPGTYASIFFIKK